MAKEPLSPQRKEELGRKLQQRLRRERPRTGRRLIIALAILILALGGLWLASRPRLEPPPLLLALPDTVGSVGSPIRLQARLEAAGAPEFDLSGEEVRWQRFDEAANPEPVKATAKGIASATLTAPNGETVFDVQASYVEPRQIYRRDDRARVFVWDRQADIVLVPLEDELLEGPIGQDPPAPRREAILTLEKAGRRTIYLMHPMGVMGYRMTRNWLREVAARHALPDGPLLMGDSPDALVTELRPQFAGGRVEVWKREPR